MSDNMHRVISPSYCRFVDRDMLMHYLGGGVGHATQPFTTTSDLFSPDIQENDGDDIQG